MSIEEKKATVNLPELKDKYFEDYLVACFQSSGFYVEHNVEYENHTVLEIDMIASDYSKKVPDRIIAEIKSGSYKHADIFKLRGQLDFLEEFNPSKGLFIVKNNGVIDENVLKKLGIELFIINENNNPLDELSEIISIDTNNYEEINNCGLPNCRFSLWTERCLIDYLIKKKKSDTSKICYQELIKYYEEINNGIFFTPTPREKIYRLYEAYRNWSHITARCANELNGDVFQNQKAPQNLFSEHLTDDRLTTCQVSAFIEHKARLAVLKSAVDFLLSIPNLELIDVIDFPQSLMIALFSLKEHKYFCKYPVFWQYFLFVMGGFILENHLDEEYNLLSLKTGIPIKNIPEALSAFDVLFPLGSKSKWFYKPKSEPIRIIKFSSVPFQGIGANYRRMYYTASGTFEELRDTLDLDKNTYNLLIKWNNLAVEVLQRDSDAT